MKKIFATGLLLTLYFVAASQNGSADYMNSIESISGSTLELVLAAMPKFQEQNLDLKIYNVSVYELDSSFLVLFDDPKREHGQRGGSPRMLVFEVEISKQGLQVIRANFVR